MATQLCLRWRDSVGSLVLARPIDAARYEIAAIPNSYRIDATVAGDPFSKSAQVRMCGNSVCQPVAAVVVRAQFAVQAGEVTAADGQAATPGHVGIVYQALNATYCGWRAGDVRGDAPRLNIGGCA